MRAAVAVLRTPLERANGRMRLPSELCHALGKDGAQMVAIATLAGQFFWNLTQPVGRGQPNSLDDVEFVRFGYVMMRASPAFGGPPPNMVEPLRLMRRSGSFDSDLDTVIRSHQAVKEIPQDGKGSVAHATAANHGRFDGKHRWIVVTLNVVAREFNFYPRIDLHPESGLEVSRAVRALLKDP